MALHETFERPRSHQKALDDLIGKAYADSRLTAQQKAVLICLAWHAKNRAGEAYPSQSTVSQLTGVCVSLVGRAIKTLADLGYIEKRDRHRKDGGKSSCLIVIAGMQYFPDDYQNQPRKAEHQVTTAGSTTQVTPASHTGGLRTRYETKKEDFLKQDSFARTPDQADAAMGQKEDFCASEREGCEPTTLIDSLTPTSQLLRRFLSYLSANRQCLMREDHDAIERFKLKPVFQTGVDAAAARLPTAVLRRHLSSFFLKRPSMARPSPNQLDDIVAALATMPACIAQLAFTKMDVIYKSGWKIPPKPEHFLACVQDELKTLTVFANATICFEMSTRSFEERQKGRGIA